MMRAFGFAVLLAAAGLPSYAAAPPEAPPDAALTKELLALNETFIAAVKAHDTAKVRSLVSRDYIAIDPYFPYLLTGEDVVADEFTAWDNYYKRPNGDQVVLRTYSQPRVRRFGDVAILTYVELDVVRTRAERNRGGRAGKCTFVYHRENGRWILVNSVISSDSWPNSVLFGSGQ